MTNVAVGCPYAINVIGTSQMCYRPRVDCWNQLVNALHAEDEGEALIVVHRVWKRVAVTVVWACLTGYIIVFIASFFLPGALLFLVHIVTRIRLKMKVLIPLHNL